MLHNTKNFLDITAIDTADQLVVSVELILHDHAIYDFTVNGISMMDTTVTFKFDLLSAMHFECKVKTGAVEVVKIAINGQEVMPKYLNHALPQTSWITNQWALTVPAPFYTWYHSITGQGWTA